MAKSSQAVSIPSVTNGSVLELPWLERILLWSIRTWAAYHDEPQAVRGHLERAFTEAGICPALESFAQLMSSLFIGLKRCPDIRCVRCLRLGKDECELLLVLAMAMQEPQATIVLRLSRLMLPAAARSGADAALEMMRVINNAGLRMEQRLHGAAHSDWPPKYQLPSSSRH